VPVHRPLRSLGPESLPALGWAVEQAARSTVSTTSMRFVIA